MLHQEVLPGGDGGRSGVRKKSLVFVFAPKKIKCVFRVVNTYVTFQNILILLACMFSVLPYIMFAICSLFTKVILIYFRQSDRPCGGGRLRPLQDQVRGLCGGDDGGGAGGDPGGGQGGGQGPLRHIRKVSVESSVEFLALCSLS